MQRCVFFIAGALLLLMISGVAESSEITLTAPQSGASVSGTTKVTISTATNVEWANFYVDGRFEGSTGRFGPWYWNTSGSSEGSHKITATAYSSSSAALGSASVTVNVANNSGSWQVTRGATISGLSGSPSGIPWADSNPYHYGQYSAWGDGYALIGGPLLTDSQAASFVKATQKSKVELGSNGTGSANAADNNYFNYIASNNPSNYLYQLKSSNGFYAGYANSSWKAEADRIDGACPIAHSTTAEVLQWAANKWGINPILLYAVVTNESGWDQTGIGDHGGSSGLLQVADRNTSSQPHHAFPGFGGAGSMLARENSCFNADFYAARLFAAFHGVIGSPGGNIGTALQSWYAGYASSPGQYTSNVYNMLSNRYWIPWKFSGASVAY